MFFFARANHPLKTCVKTYINHFHGNYFWTSSKSFSCAVNHFQTSKKWFLTHVNDYFLQKTARDVFFVAVNHLLKMISKWKAFFLAQAKHHFHLKIIYNFWSLRSNFETQVDYAAKWANFCKLKVVAICEKHHLCSIFVVTFSS